MLVQKLFRHAVAAALFAGIFAAAPAQAEITVLRNFTLIDGTGRAPAPSSAMIIDNGRISWIGPVAQLTVPAGAMPVDLTNKFVMPGIIDLHVHLGLVNGLMQDIKYYTRENVEKDLRTYASYGVTAVQVLGTDKDLIFPLRAEQRKDGRPAMARVYTAGQGLVFKGSYGGVPGLNQPVATVAEATKAVDEQAAKGVDLIKFWMDDELGTLPVRMPYTISKAIIDAAHRHNLRVVAHIFYLADAKMLVDQSVDGLAHSVRDKPVDQALLDAMKKHGTWQFAGTLSREAVLYAYGMHAPFLDDPFFTRSVAPDVVKTLGSMEREKNIASGPLYSKYDAIQKMAKANFKREADAGVSYALGTDSGPAGRFPGYFAHWELQLMVEAGLTPMQALTAATGSAAKFLGAKDFGTLEKGKWADLIVLDANPVMNIKNTHTIRTVYIAGKTIQR